MRGGTILHAISFALLCSVLMFILHLVPVNHLFIDPFSEAIKGHDMMDIAISRFRDHNDPDLFDDRILLINTGITNRREIASVVDFLGRNDVAAIGVDLLFDTLFHNQDDSLLRISFQHHPKVILGYTFESSADDSHSTIVGLQSDTFFSSNVFQGYVNLATNDGFTVRAFEPFRNINDSAVAAFSVYLASLRDDKLLDEMKQRCSSTEWINFKRLQPGEINMTYPINSGHQVHYRMVHIDNFLKDTSHLDHSWLKDKIILLGFCGETEEAFSMKDRYFTPLNEQYTGRSLPDMHGVVVHANIISMLLDRDLIHDVSERGIYGIAFLIFVLNYWIFTFLHRHDFFRSLPYIRLVQVFQFFIFLAICILLLLNFNIKLGFTFIATCIILSYELYEFYLHKVKNWVEESLSTIGIWVTRNRIINHK